eukprot:Hpha_TRINITY_DN16378_c0_g3::TRINITY_DN16378_c0_g3_i1::g.61297::m.61297
MADEVKDGTKKVIDGTPKALAGVFAGSAMVMVKAAIQCDDYGSNWCKDYNAWALACATIGLVVSMTMIILLLCCPDFKKNVAWLILVIFLGCLWIAGVGTMTFKRPYKNTADNGYFGAWIATLSAISLVSEAFQSVCEDMKNKLPSGEAWNWWFILLAGSSIAMIQSAIDCDEASTCEKELAWALACSTISVVVCLVMIILVCVTDIGAEVWKWISLFLVIWWLAGTGVTTYEDGPYKSLGNGYFAVWIALIAAFRLFGLMFFTGSTKEVEGALEDTEKFARQEGNAHIAGLMVFSLAVLIAAGIHCDDSSDCKDYAAWAVACSAISFIICLFLLIAIFFGFIPNDVFGTLKWVCALLLLLMWAAGTYTMTFKRPFKGENGNGYFGAWISLIIAWWFATSTVPGLKGAAAKLTQYGGWAYQVLAIGSLIEGLQAAHDCSDFDCGENHLGWAVACGWISFIAVIVVIILIACGCWSRIVSIIFAIFFACWWTAGAGVLTYDKPYLSFGNAYFGTWIATICAYLVLANVLLYDGDGTEVPEAVPEVTGGGEEGNEPAK